MITVREAHPDDAPGIANVHVKSWRTTYQGIVSPSYLEGLSVESRERFWTQVMREPEPATCVYVATDDTGRVVGFASGGPQREGRADYTGELYAIYLLREHQRGGVGRRLTQAVVDHLINQGYTSMLVWVLADNPSRRFYESLGGQPSGEKPIEIGGVTLGEIAYEWSDLRQLMERLVDR